MWLITTGSQAGFLLPVWLFAVEVIRQGYLVVMEWCAGYEQDLSGYFQQGSVNVGRG